MDGLVSKSVRHFVTVMKLMWFIQPVIGGMGYRSYFGKTPSTILRLRVIRAAACR